MTTPPPKDDSGQPPPVAVTITDVRVDETDDHSVQLELGPAEERYELMTLLGQGGMGEVFEAKDRLFSRQVALKFVKPTASRKQFFREAQTSGLLTHPNIPPVYDVGVDGSGRPYYAMQLIRGRTLAEVFDEREQFPDRWSLQRLLALFQSICSALSYAHERGLAHLDIKPGNVMIGELAQLYVVDWGLSATEADDIREIRGTPAYMSPEQATGGEAVGATSDVFSAGVVLYEICCGQRAFPGESGSEVMEQVRTGRFQTGPEWNRISAELRQIVTRALQREPRERPTARELSDQVQEFLDGTREAARKRQLAEEALGHAEAALKERELGLERLSDLEARARALRPESWVSASERTDFWEAENEIEAARLEVELALQRAMGHLLEAHRTAEGEDLLERLAALYWDRFVDSESRGERFETEFLRGQLESLGLASYRERLEAGGSLEIVCDTTPSSITMSRLGEQDRILAPVDSRELPNAEKVATEELPVGSYQLQVRSAGRQAAIVPVAIRRQTRSRLSLTLRTSEEIGEGFVWIPGGEFSMGSDDPTLNPCPRRVVEVDDYCIARHPVTWTDYRGYLQARVDHEEDVAEWLPSHEIPPHGPVWHVVGNQVRFARNDDARVVRKRRDWPVFSVTWFQAREYCRWQSERLGFSFDLPTDEEWEKAARGVDGRKFPWGNRFDPSLTRNAGSEEVKAQPGPVGEFETDCSPYGVRDMGGTIREWCSSWFDEKDEQRVVRGGAWNGSEIGAHCAYRLGCTPNSAYHFIGFRMVHRF